jgi:methionyl-tRNA formyltransferase
VFFGSGAFAVPVLDALVAAPEVAVVGVVSAPDRPAGRGGGVSAVPVAARTRDLGLTLLQPASIRGEEAVMAIAALQPDLGVLADYGRIVPPAILELPRHGILNVHPSLLPRHRGATPVAATIVAGDPVAGVTLILMDAGLDTGPIIAAGSWPLDGTETTPELEARAAAEGAALLRGTLAGWLGGSVVARPQPTEGATLTRPLRREDGRLDPTCPVGELERRVRAYQPWPGSFVETSAGRLVVWRSSVVPTPGRSAGDTRPGPGYLVALGGGLGLTAADGTLALDEVQLAARRRMGSDELRRGQPGLIGERVG